MKEGSKEEETEAGGAGEQGERGKLVWQQVTWSTRKGNRVVGEGRNRRQRRKRWSRGKDERGGVQRVGEEMLWRRRRRRSKGKA